MKTCGSCTMCCKLLGIKEIAKPTNKWCGHCEIGKGCRIYDNRPQSCREFECLYLMSFDQGTTPAIELRPDKCKVVIAPTTDEHIFSAHVDPGNRDAWEKPGVLGLIESICKAGFRVIVGWGDTPEKILVEHVRPGVIGKRRITMSMPDENGVQWYEPEK